MALSKNHKKLTTIFLIKIFVIFLLLTVALGYQILQSTSESEISYWVGVTSFGSVNSTSIFLTSVVILFTFIYGAYQIIFQKDKFKEFEKASQKKKANPLKLPVSLKVLLISVTTFILLTLIV